MLSPIHRLSRGTRPASWSPPTCLGRGSGGDMAASLPPLALSAGSPAIMPSSRCSVSLRDQAMGRGSTRPRWVAPRWWGTDLNGREGEGTRLEEGSYTAGETASSGPGTPSRKGRQSIPWRAPSMADCELEQLWRRNRKFIYRYSSTSAGFGRGNAGLECGLTNLGEKIVIIFHGRT
jgi:hypothetical protein